MFDMREEGEADARKLAQMMQNLGVFISIKPKIKQTAKVLYYPCYSSPYVLSFLFKQFISNFSCYKVCTFICFFKHFLGSYFLGIVVFDDIWVMTCSPVWDISQSVVVKGLERNISSVYEARHLLLGLDSAEVGMTTKLTPDPMLPGNGLTNYWLSMLLQQLRLSDQSK